MKTRFFAIVSGLALLVGCFGCAPRTSTPAPTGLSYPPASSGAEWTSSAHTVAELATESDVIVLAEVVSAPEARTVTQELPQMNAEGTAVAMVTDTMLFSDTTFQVREVYSGTVADQISIMQTGGVSPTIGYTEGPIDDPLYAVGEVYVLFLVDISEDPIQAPNKVLYRTVNPAGRFLIEGSSVRSYLLDGQQRSVQPDSLDDLIDQIRREAP